MVSIVKTSVPLCRNPAVSEFENLPDEVPP